MLCIIVIAVESFHHCCFQTQHHKKHQYNIKLCSQSVDDCGGCDNKEMDASTFINRRDWLTTTTSSVLILPVTAAITTNSASAAVEEGSGGSKTMSATWSALSGLETNDDKVVAFDEKAYKAMRDDKSRTPLFQKVRKQVKTLHI